MNLCVTVEGSPRVNALPSSSSSTWPKMSNKSNPVSLLPHLVLQRKIKIKTLKIQGVHGTGNKQYCLLGCDEVLYGRYKLVFHRKLQPPSSG